MRTLMMIASVAMIGAGIFCVANASAAFQIGRAHV